ncbi:MAG: tRNA pseudouridine(38-40) synthase TruA [Chitinophagaceae bacterium]|nr:tRNA pseudouridine(38-40) synthase TruA [Chitinophagaceae bacterium]
MSRYFLEVSYKGTAYAGFQVQQNALTVQEEVEKALEVFLRERVVCTGSSRTDAGVHARQNYFHFDFNGEIGERNVYNINALLPGDIAVKSLREVAADAHCRFDAKWREYVYRIYGKKDPFIADTAYFFPYTLDMAVMAEVAAVVKEYEEFEAFSKRRTQVKTYSCKVMESIWEDEGDVKIYRVRANRFLRGMVRGLVGTMLQVGRGKNSVDGFRKIIEQGNQADVDFSVPGSGLCLERVEFGDGYFG